MSERAVNNYVRCRHCLRIKWMRRLKAFLRWCQRYPGVCWVITTRRQQLLWRQGRVCSALYRTTRHLEFCGRCGPHGRCWPCGRRCWSRRRLSLWAGPRHEETPVLQASCVRLPFLQRTFAFLLVLVGDAKELSDAMLHWPTNTVSPH